MIFDRVEHIIRRWLLVGGFLLASVVLAGAQAKPDKPVQPAAQPAAAPKASYVGSVACKACHAKVVEPWLSSPHGKSLTQPSLPSELTGCEACHGPASVHIGSGAQNKPRVPKADDAAGTNAICGACHFEDDSSKAPKEAQNLSSGNFARSMHGRKGLSCLSCHSGHPNGNDKALRKPGKDLCLTCHGQVLESSPGKNAAYTHSPVAQGQCLTCHDPHGTDDPSMLVSNIQSVCQGCHNVNDAKLQAAHQDYPLADSKCTTCHDAHSHDKAAGLIQGKLHMPFKQGKCNACHNKPAPGQPVGLIKPAKELCFGCHPASVIMPGNEKSHLPVKEGLCLSCHNPHVSNQKALLKADLSSTCFACHKKVEDATVAKHRHKVLEGNMNCMLCHKPHSSGQDSLMVKDEVALCGQCHKHSFSHPIAKKADGTVIKDPTTGTVLICSSCHDVHGGEFESLTKGDKGRDLCVRCHSKLEH
ncbi:MAG: cytochrome c3 family protein [Armatimonadota bacterium]